MNRYLIDDNGDLLNSDTFYLPDFLADVDQDMLTSSGQYRKELTKYNPLLFMLIYVPHLMRSEETGDAISVNDINILLAHYAMEWIVPKSEPKRNGLRKSFLCPRSSSKTTTTQALMLWAFCHKHIKYAFIFAESDPAAQTNLSELKNEIGNNRLIKSDFKDLTIPEFRADKNIAKEDNKNLYISHSGVIIEARSIHSSVLGSKRNGRRPDLLMIDDTSKGEGVGSINISGKQLDIILGTILPMNDCAPVWLVGTVHYVGSVESELIRSTQGESFNWITEEKIEVHHVKPLIERDDGSLRSLWPERWSVSWLLEHSSDTTYAKDFLCEPVSRYSGSGFTKDLFVIEQPLSLSKTILSFDPAISDKGDANGLAVIGFSSVARKAYLLEVLAVHQRATDLKTLIVTLCSTWGVDMILWEDNQGGSQLAYATLGNDFPLHIEFVHARDSKEIRAELLLNRYKRDQIRHTKPLPSYISECLQFPNFVKSPNCLDAVGHGITYLANVGRTPQKLAIRNRRVH